MTTSFLNVLTVQGRGTRPDASSVYCRSVVNPFSVEYSPTAVFFLNFYIPHTYDAARLLLLLLLSQHVFYSLFFIYFFSLDTHQPKKNPKTKKQKQKEERERERERGKKREKSKTTKWRKWVQGYDTWISDLQNNAISGDQTPPKMRFWDNVCTEIVWI